MAERVDEVVAGVRMLQALDQERDAADLDRRKDRLAETDMRGGRRLRQALDARLVGPFVKLVPFAPGVSRPEGATPGAAMILESGAMAYCT